jgi:hypothetical protein
MKDETGAHTALAFKNENTVFIVHLSSFIVPLQMTHELLLPQKHLNTTQRS